jgi:hypothetical protein
MSDHQIFNSDRNILLHIQTELRYKTFKEIMNSLDFSQNVDNIKFYILCELFIELLECVNY